MPVSLCGEAAPVRLSLVDPWPFPPDGVQRVSSEANLEGDWVPLPWLMWRVGDGVSSVLFFAD